MKKLTSDIFKTKSRLNKYKFALLTKSVNGKVKLTK